MSQLATTNVKGIPVRHRSRCNRFILVVGPEHRGRDFCNARRTYDHTHGKIVGQNRVSGHIKYPQASSSAFERNTDQPLPTLQCMFMSAGWLITPGKMKVPSFKTVESRGGPFLLVAKDRLLDWGGVDSCSYFDPDEHDENTDYEILCDLQYEQRYEESSKKEKEFFIMFSVHLGLHVAQRGITTIITDRLMLPDSKFVIEKCVDGTVGLHPEFESKEFVLKAGKYVLFEAAWPGNEALERAILLATGSNTPLKLRSFMALESELGFPCYELTPIAS